LIEINDRRSLIGPLRSLLATLFAVAALHAENASTRVQRLSIEKPIKSCQGFLLTKSNGLFSATRLFRQPLLHAITAGREFAFLGKTPRNGISSRKRARVKMGSTVQAARYFSQSLSELGRFSESLKQGCRCYTATTTVLMGVPYRRSPIRTSGNGGTSSAPVFSRIWAPIAHNTAISTSRGPIAVPLRADRRITRRALPILHPETASLCSFSAASLQRFALAVTRRGQPIARSNRVPERLMPSLVALSIPDQILPLDQYAPRS
jgi:hypothetical protein